LYSRQNLEDLRVRSEMRDLESGSWENLSGTNVVWQGSGENTTPRVPLVRLSHCC
jgi:hypothetical protein